MITLDRVRFFYSGSDKPALEDTTFSIPEGAFVLVTGSSGSGKTTLLRCLNGLVPHFYGGRFGGTVKVFGADTRITPVRLLSENVGLVFQDSTSQFVTESVESEIAFGMENLGLDGREIARRVSETIETMELDDLVKRPVATLSGGEKQKVAIASMLAMRPRVIVLDEPTAELDPTSSDELLSTLKRLNRETGLTVVLAEHRLERVIQAADTVIELQAGRVRTGPTAEMLSVIRNAPPIIELGRRLGWQPLPVTVDEARPFAATLLRPEVKSRRDNGERSVRQKVAYARDLSFSFNGTRALKSINMDVNAGEVLAIMGRNGAGKTTLIKQFCGLLKPAEGQVVVAGLDTKNAAPADIFRQVGYVPQRPGVLLFADTVSEEISGTGARRPETDRLIEEMGLECHVDDYPRDLSQGEQQRVALAAVMAGNPSIILFDEPTHGLDHEAKISLVRSLRKLATDGRAVVMAIHDVETAALAADRVVVLEAGSIIADGPPQETMAGSAILSTQVNRLFGGPYLTVDDVAPQSQG